jgi:AraC-like DNA-binding protein
MERALVDHELIVMEKGTLYVEDEWERFEVHEGEWLLMEPTKLQKGYQSSKCSFYWMHFIPHGEAQGAKARTRKTEGKAGGKAEGKLEGLARITIPKEGKLKNADRVYVLLKQLQDSDLRYMDPNYNGYLATAVLQEIANQAKGMEEGAEFKLLRERVEDYLLTHMQRSISVGELAAHFGYHEKYFSSLFKEETGQTVKKFVDGRKMERAKYLLLNTDALVVEIAESLGFEEVQNFYHVFKAHANCTPSEFRETYSKKQEFDK